MPCFPCDIAIPSCASPGVEVCVEAEAARNPLCDGTSLGTEKWELVG